MTTTSTRFTLITDKFYKGIDAISSASIIMRDIFECLPTAVEMVTDDQLYEDEAMWAILDTLRVYKPYPKGDIPWTQRVIHIGNYELEYLNRENVMFCWKREKVDDNIHWVFWVLLPEEYYQEPTAGGLMGPRLERAGFTREALVA